MDKIYFKDDKGLVTRTLEFTYIESSFIDGNEISNTIKTWTADNLNDYDRFREIWEQLEAFDSNYHLTEFGTLEDDGIVTMLIEYTLETDQRETIKFIRGISYKIAE